MCIAGYKSIARFDPARRNRVLFGETAAIASPLPFIRNALCIDAKGRALRGRPGRLQGCRGKVAKLNIGGLRHPPLQPGGNGTPRQRVRKTKTALPMAHMPRLHRLMSQAVRRGRIPRGTGIFITEFGFQTEAAGPVLERLAHRAGAVHQRVRPALLRRIAGSRRSTSTS